MLSPATGPVASATSVDFTSARTRLPSVSPRSFTESSVMAAVSSWPEPRRTLTVAITSPAVTVVTVPGSWLRMLRLMGAASFFDRGNDGFRPCRCPP